jgi:hypothetical protein
VADANQNGRWICAGEGHSKYLPNKFLLISNVKSVDIKKPPNKSRVFTQKSKPKLHIVTEGSVEPK